MITNAHMTGSPSFATTDATLGPLKKINFVYGPNGAGKTTVSRVLGDASLYPGTSVDFTDANNPPEVKVYNRDYVSRTLLESHRLTGVFTLDDEDPEARKELEDLKRDGGTISQLQIALDKATAKRDAIAKAANDRREELKASAWAKRDEIPNELQPMFEGVKSSKATFLTKLLATVKTTAPSIDDLKREAASAFDTSATTKAEIPLVSRDTWSSLPGASWLGTVVAGSSDISLSELISTLDNGDWVAQGRDYLEHSNGVCPFCQQALPADFLREFAEHFDETYRQRVEELNHLSRAFSAFASEARSWWASIAQLDETFVEAEEVSTASATWEAALTRAEAALRGKLTNPSHLVTLDDFGPLLTDADQIATTANERIHAHNERVGSRAASRRALIERCWTYFAWGLLASEMGNFTLKKPGSDKALQEADDALGIAKVALDEAVNRAAEIERGLVSSAPTIERINKLLDKVGFATFRITQSSAVSDGYSLTRPTGELVADSLSDGERTFITFLYYVAQLEGAIVAADTRPVSAIIDDPISSLDSDVLFLVSSLVRSLMAKVHKDDTRLKQMVLLTHNVHFYVEVTYVREQDRRDGLATGRQHFEIVKNPKTGSTIHSLAEGSVKSSYARLWEEVRAAGSSTEPVGVGLENVMRRILENYFKILGGVRGLDDLTDHFVGDELTICRSLFSWLNHGSHSFFDEIEYSTHGMSVEAHLKVFRDIFDKADQLDHYRMMMNETEIDEPLPEDVA